MKTGSDRRLDVVAAIGLGIGALFGLAGTFISQPDLQSLVWGIDGVGLMIATSLLTLRFFRKGNDLGAAGFLVFAIGQAMIILSAPMGLEPGVPAFGTGVALWATALAMISIPNEFPLPVRLVGMVAALLFVVVAVQIFLGTQLLPTSSPLPFFAYPVFVLTLVGWIWALLKR
jgi:hypothetical protein